LSTVFTKKEKTKKNNLHHRLKRLSFGGFRKKNKKEKQNKSI